MCAWVGLHGGRPGQVHKGNHPGSCFLTDEPIKLRPWGSSSGPHRTYAHPGKTMSWVMQKGKFLVLGPPLSLSGDSVDCSQQRPIPPLVGTEGQVQTPRRWMEVAGSTGWGRSQGEPSSCPALQEDIPGSTTGGDLG